MSIIMLQILSFLPGTEFLLVTRHHEKCYRDLSYKYIDIYILILVSVGYEWHSVYQCLLN